MNKKGIVWETLADVFLAGVILFIGISLFFLSSGLQQKKIDTYFSEKTVSLNNDMIFLSYLEAKNETVSFNDIVTRAYFTEDTSGLEEDLDNALERVYSQKMCWILEKDDREWIKKNSCSKPEQILNSSAYMPIPGRDPIKLSLLIKGYAK